MSDHVRYGYYLRPSPEMCAAQVRVHVLLERQFGLRVAGRFMPHCTVKGFFKSSAPLDEIRAAAASITGDMRSFPIWNNGIMGWAPEAIVLGIMRTPGSVQNQEMRELHDRALAALLPIVDDDCNFSPEEWVADRYEAHLTLAVADIPPKFFDEILGFCQGLAPVGPESFMAERLHLYTFESDDWHGAWGESLTWQLIDSWALASE